MTDQPLKQCSRCHEHFPTSDFHKNRSMRDGLAPWCKSCTKRNDEVRRERKLATQAAWYQANRERLIAKQSEKQRDDPQYVTQKQHRYYQRHHDKQLKYQAAYREQNRELVRQRCIRWREQNPDKKRADGIAWRRANRMKVNQYSAIRRARQLNAPIVEDIDRAAIIARDDAICHICGLFVPDDQMSLDHVIPLVKGGSHTADNLKVAHRRCNSRKSAKLLRSA